MPNRTKHTPVNVPKKGECGFQSLPETDPLTEDERFQVVVWLAQFNRPIEIPRLVKERFNKIVSNTYAYAIMNRKKFMPMLDRKRQEWAHAMGEVPLAHKRYRLEKLNQMLDRVESNPDIPTELKEFRMLRILDKARLEMEEGKTAFTFNYFQAINNYSDNELISRRDELIKKIQSMRLPTRRVDNGTMGNGSEIIEAAASVSPESNGGS